MSLIDLPQPNGAAHRPPGYFKRRFLQDRAAVDGGLSNSPGGPGWNTWIAPTLRVNATAGLQGPVDGLCGFPSPLARATGVDGGLSDGPLPGKRRPGDLNLATAGNLWGTEKLNQWVCRLALAGPMIPSSP